MIREAETAIRNAPEGSVQIKSHGKSVQFYHRLDPKAKNGVYIPAAERKKALALVQKQYCVNVIKAARKQSKAIERFLTRYDPNEMKQVFAMESGVRQKFIKPFMLPDELFAEEWQNSEYEGKAFRDDAAVHYTQKEERVRSKSEVLIADALARAHIPYHYECPITIGGRVIYPDFTVLRMKDRKTLYWEHLGMMDDTEYRNNAFQRIRDYEMTGVFPGDDLILTFETYHYPLNSAIVDRMIRHFLL